MPSIRPCFHLHCSTFHTAFALAQLNIRYKRNRIFNSLFSQDKARGEDFQTGFAKMANAMYLKDKDQDG